MPWQRRWLAVLFCATGTWARGDEVSWTASVVPATAHPGEVVELRLTAHIAAGWRIYAAEQTGSGPVATSLSLPEDLGLSRIGPLREPEPERHLDEGFGIEVLTHQGEVTFRQPLRVPDAAPRGELDLTGQMRSQACNDTSCMPPADVDVHAALRVEPGPVRPAQREAEPETSWTGASPDGGDTPVAKPSAGGAPPVTESVADEARAEGLFAFLLVAFAAGFAALLTPCVFPMVPITVSFFTKQAGDSARKRIGLAAFYGLGIVVMYTGLGLLLAATMGAAGAQRLAASPGVNLFIAGLFVFFALSLFGLFELTLPSGLVNLSSRQSDAGGYLGALFMGVTLTLAAFTCTVQFVGGVLVWAANGELLWPVLGMLSFSAAFALPFFLLALFPQYLSSLPRSGGWLENTKVVLGFVELGAAFKFLSNADLVWTWRLMSRETILGVWALLSFLTALFLWGKLVMGHAPRPEPGHLGRGRQWWAMLFCLLSLYLLWGLNGARLGGLLEALLPPPDYTRDAQRREALEAHWLSDYAAALDLASSRGTKLFVDFTGVTCTNCRWMEQNMFTRQEIRERLRHFTLVHLYTDSGDQALANRQMQEDRYHTASLPYYAIVTADDQVVATFDGLTRDPAEFAAFLDRGK